MHDASKSWMMIFAVALVGCGGTDEHAGPTEGVATNSTCPPAQTLTYENFGKTFFSSYCLRCHSSKVMGDARAGAPTDHNFDEIGDVKTLAGHIDELAAAGPAGTNKVMPPSAPTPNDDERRQLGEWLACGAP